MLPRQLVLAALEIFRSVVSEKAWWCCDINSVSWQLWNRAAKKGNTVNHAVCPNVSSERPRSLTSNNMMVLTSTDRPYTNLSESVCCPYPCYSPCFYAPLTFIKFGPVYICLPSSYTTTFTRTFNMIRAKVHGAGLLLCKFCACLLPDGQNRLLVFVLTPDENVVSWTLRVCVVFSFFL